MSNVPKPKYVLLFSIPLITLVVTLFIVQGQRFHIVSTSPSLSNVAQVSPYIYVNFNKSLDVAACNASSKDQIITGYAIKGKQLQVSLNERLDMSKVYKIKIVAKALASDQNVVKEISFTARDIPVEDLPKQQQDLILLRQRDYLKSQSDPIIRSLPHGTLDYNLTSEYVRNGSKSDLILHASLLLTGADLKGDSTSIVNQYKQEVVDYIKSLGLDPTKYTIDYSTGQ